MKVKSYLTCLLIEMSTVNSNSGTDSKVIPGAILQAEVAPPTRNMFQFLDNAAKMIFQPPSNKGTSAIQQAEVAPPAKTLFQFLDNVAKMIFQPRSNKGTSAIQQAEVAPPATTLFQFLNNVARMIFQPSPRAGYQVQVWEADGDAPTVERFLQDLAKEKPIRFTAKQLSTFTSNYSTRLGSGGFGVVYKGQFPNGVKIAVKLLNRTLNKTVKEQFMAEVGTIGRTYHRNLVRLYGFCYDKLSIGLVYEYMENGSLDKYLFSNTGATIEWDKLHGIAVGTAKGIAYLHEECQQRIIHYDIKPGNVLLDADFSPKVADFGLAKLYNHNTPHVMVLEYKGTPGYSAPEFMFRNFPITQKCDVYSFGILLFEMVGRRRNSANVGSTDSLDWFPKRVWDEYEKGALAAVTTGCGIEETDRVSAEKMCMVALWCVQDSPDARPPMSAIVKMLEGGEMEIMPPPRPFNYLFSMRKDMMVETSSNDNKNSDISTCKGTNSYWYTKSIPII